MSITPFLGALKHLIFTYFRNHKYNVFFDVALSSSQMLCNKSSLNLWCDIMCAILENLGDFAPGGEYRKMVSKLLC